MTHAQWPWLYRQLIAAGINPTDAANIAAGISTSSGAVSSVAGRTGDVVLTKSDVSLGSVDNTADTAKPVSTAQQTALDLKANLASPTFTGTVGGISKSMVGLGSVDNTADTAKPVSTAQQTALNGKVDLSTITTKGDLLAGSAASTAVRIGVGADGLHLAADSSQTSGLTWKFTTAPRVRTMISGNYYGHTGAVSFATSAQTQSKLFMSPFWVPQSITINQIACDVTVVAASSTVRMGVYNSNANDQPSTVLFDAGTVATDTSTGAATITVSQTFGPGLYWLAAVSQGGAPTLRTVANGMGWPVASTTFVGANAFTCYSQAAVTGALPTITTWSADNAPTKVGVKIA